jgi:hypothetical protein
LPLIARDCVPHQKSLLEQVRRLGTHASIAIWGGNNENEEALNWYRESREHRDTYLVDEVALYVDTVLPAISAADADRRPVVDTSPSNGLLSREPYVKRWGATSSQADAAAGAWGDIHYYNSAADCEDPSTYPSARFVSEHGFQAFPAMAAYEAVSAPADWSRESSLVRWRMRHPDGDAQALAMLRRHFRVPPANASHAAAHAASHAASHTAPHAAASVRRPVSEMERAQGVNSQRRLFGEMERGFPPPPLPPPMMTMPNPPSELSPQPPPSATPPPPPPTRGWSSWGQRRLFDEYLFLTQAQQARCYEVAFGRWRRDRGRAAFTMGILYWQLNAIWPGPDWATIEYDGRLRLSHYSVARAFAPLALSVELDVADDGSALDGRLRVHAASDLPGAVAGTLRVDVHLWATAPAWPAHSLEVPVSIAAEASAMVHEVSLVALGLGPGAKIARDDAFVRLSFEPNDASAAPGAVPSTGRVFVDVWLTPFKSARMTRAQPAIVSLAQTSLTRAVLRILSNATVALVAVESDAVVGAFSDGAFTLLAGEVRELTFEARAPFALEQMRQGLSVRSVWDTYEGEEAT